MTIISSLYAVYLKIVRLDGVGYGPHPGGGANASGTEPARPGGAIATIDVGEMYCVGA